MNYVHDFDNRITHCARVSPKMGVIILRVNEGNCEVSILFGQIYDIGRRLHFP